MYALLGLNELIQIDIRDNKSTLWLYILWYMSAPKHQQISVWTADQKHNSQVLYIGSKEFSVITYNHGECRFNPIMCVVISECMSVSFKWRNKIFLSQFSWLWINLYENIHHTQLIIYFMWNSVFLATLLTQRGRWRIYMRQWTGSALVQIVACPLSGAKPLPELMVIYCQSDPQEQNQEKFKWKYDEFILKMYLKMSSAKWCPFCLSFNVLLLNLFSINRYLCRQIDITDILVHLIAWKWCENIWPSGTFIQDYIVYCQVTIQTNVFEFQFCICAPLPRDKLKNEVRENGNKFKTLWCVSFINMVCIT